MHSAAVILLIAPLFMQATSDRLVGAPEPAQLSETRRNELIKYAIDQYNAQSNSAYVHKAVDATITSQVVNGALYKIDMDIAETDCRKGVIGKECKLKYPDGSNNIKCKINIHEQPWLNQRSVTIKNCDKPRKT